MILGILSAYCFLLKKSNQFYHSIVIMADAIQWNTILGLRSCIAVEIMHEPSLICVYLYYKSI